MTSANTGGITVCDGGGGGGSAGVPGEGIGVSMGNTSGFYGTTEVKLFN